MSELQSEELGVDNDEYVEVDENENAEIQEDESSELAPDSEPQHEQNSEELDDGRVNQEAINKVINRKHYEAQEAKRQADEYKRELEKYQQQSSQAPKLPDRPDPFDDDYDSKMQEYERAVAAKAKHDHEQQYRQQLEQQERQRQQLEQQQKTQESVQSYVERGKKNGMTVEEMTQAGQIVESYGLSPDLQQALLIDDDGPLIVKHLAANPALTSQLSAMSPYQAALHLERAVRGEAKRLKPKTTNAPTPNKRMQSGGVDPELGKYKHIGGAKFE